LAELTVRHIPSAQPEPCTDTVSRDDALYVLDEFQESVENGTPCYAMARVKMCGLSTVKPETTEPEWTPVSKEMPEPGDEVLTTYAVCGDHSKRFVETATYYDGDAGYWSSPWDEYRVPGTKIEVIAWKPMPKPWKGEG
jgi:hypothetical protein